MRKRTEKIFPCHPTAELGLTAWLPLASWITAIGTVLLAIVAVFQERIRLLLFGARLDLEPGPFYPDSQKVPLSNKEGQVLGEACCLGIGITNHGPCSAEKVEVFLAKLEKEAEGVFEEDHAFYGLNLTWRHYNTVFLDRLLAHTTRDCALGRIADPKIRQIVGDDHPTKKLPGNRSPFRLEVAAVPNTRSDLLLPGKYRLHLEIGAANTKRVKRRIIELQFTGEWLPNTREMLVAAPV